MSDKRAECSADTNLDLLLMSKPQAFDAVLKFYTEQFKYSASQRISTIQYFVAAFAFLTGGYTTLLTSQQGEALSTARIVVALTAYVLTLAFARLDRRNKQIVELDEKPLIRLQEAIALALKDDDRVWHSFDRRDKDAERFTTYGDIVPIIYLVAAVVAALGAGAGLEVSLPIQALVALLLIYGGRRCIYAQFSKKLGKPGGHTIASGRGEPA